MKGARDASGNAPSGPDAAVGPSSSQISAFLVSLPPPTFADALLLWHKLMSRLRSLPCSCRGKGGLVGESRDSSGLGGAVKWDGAAILGRRERAGSPSLCPPRWLSGPGKRRKTAPAGPISPGAPETKLNHTDLNALGEITHRAGGFAAAKVILRG